MNTNGNSLALKSIPLQNLPPEAFKVVVGDNQTSGNSVFDYYERVPWLYRGVEARRNALAGIPFAFHKGDENGEEYDESVLPFDIEFVDILGQLTLYYILCGAWYLFKGTNPANFVKDVRVFHPDTITPKYDASVGVKSFERRIGSTKIDIDKDELLYVWKPASRKEVGIGVSDAKVALAAAGIINNIDSYQSQFFAQGAINPTLVTVPNGIMRSDKERIETWYRRAVSGLKNAFKISVVEGDKPPQAVTIGANMKDLETPALNDSKRQDIATALGVPQTLLFSNAANYATAQQDDLHFYDKTVIPDAKRFERALNNGLFKQLGYTFKFHYERMEVYQQLEAQKSSSVVALFDKGIMTLDEVREHMNLAPLPQKDPTPQPISGQQPDTNRTDTPPTVENAPQIDAPAAKATHVHTHEETPVKADLEKWQAVALKRLKENKFAKALEFTSDVIRPTMLEAIKGSLEGLTDANEIKRVFSHALEWAAYP